VINRELRNAVTERGCGAVTPVMHREEFDRSLVGTLASRRLAWRRLAASVGEDWQTINRLEIGRLTLHDD
jgi:hypothetical protein